MGQTHVNALKAKTSDALDRLHIKRKKPLPTQRAESQQGLQAQSAEHKCEGGVNGENRGSTSDRWGRVWG